MFSFFDYKIRYLRNLRQLAQMRKQERISGKLVLPCVIESLLDWAGHGSRLELVMVDSAVVVVVVVVARIGLDLVGIVDAAVVRIGGAVVDVVGTMAVVGRVDTVESVVAVVRSPFDRD